MIQICGTILIGLCLICLTWYGVTLMQLKTKKAEDARKRREARNERIFNNEALSLYEDERQRRIALETRIGIVEHQLARAKEQMSKVKVKEAR